MALPFGLSNIAATYQDALRGKFADQVGDVHPLTDQLSSAVNMLYVGRCPRTSLQTILEENLDFESQRSTETVAETTAEQVPPFHGGIIFNVSSPPWEGETEEDRAACVNRNINCV